MSEYISSLRVYTELLLLSLNSYYASFQIFGVIFYSKQKQKNGRLALTHQQQQSMWFIFHNVCYSSWLINVQTAFENPFFMDNL